MYLETILKTVLNLFNEKSLKQDKKCILKGIFRMTLTMFLPA